MDQQSSQIEWQKLENKFDKELLRLIRERLESNISPEIDPKLIKGASPIAIIEILNELSAMGHLRTINTIVCPVLNCNNPLDSDDIENKMCPKCKTNYRETGDKPVEQKRFLVFGHINRAVPWLIAVHGMNTDGKWQEDFSWKIANKFRYHAPVLIYKYGVIRYQVLFEYYHKKFAVELGNKIIAAGKHAKLNGIAEPPDMIVHSFGSLIFATLLRMDNFKHLVFGRVIVAGGIVKPDFEWSEFIDANRIEVVFNHCSKKDVTVLFAQYFIPNSGPSGAKGFTDGSIFNVLDLKFTHSSYFDPDTLERNLSNKGAWDVFLRDPIEAVSQTIAIYYPDVNWKPRNILFRFMTWSIAVILPIIIVILLIFQILKLL